MSLAGDVRSGVRKLARNPAFAVLAIAIVALGIGVNAAVFTVANAVLFQGFPHIDPDNRLLYIVSLRNGTSGGETSYPDFLDWRARARSFRGMAAVATGGLRLILDDGAGAPETCDGTQLSANAFQVLGRKPILGRDFAASDETPGAPAVAILNYSFWERRYGKDPRVIGKALRINGAPATVVGVMPPAFYFPHHRVDLWMPIVPDAALGKRQNRVLWFAFGRLADGVTIDRAQAELDVIGRQLERSYPLTNFRVLPKLMDFRRFFIGQNASALYGALWGAVGLVLLIVCANLANLLLARAISRSREISVRIALGASRWRIARQLLVESLILSSIGGLFGWVIAVAGVRAYELAANPPGSYNRWDYSLDYRVCFYLIAISILTGLLFGLAPAMRVSKLNVNATLKDGGRGATAGGSRKGLSALLVTGQTALAMVLLAAGGLMMRSFLNIYTADIGVATSHILTASVDLATPAYSGPERQIAFSSALAARLKRIPGVDSLALSNSLPGLYAPRLPYDLAGSSLQTDNQSRPGLSTLAIGPDYFRALGATLLDGREFNDFDGASAPPVAIVNQRCAAKFWPGESAIGKRLRFFHGKVPGVWRTVVGVASNIVQNDATAQTFDPVAYVPFRQDPSPFLVVLARTSMPPASLASAFRNEIHALDPSLVVGSGLGSVGGPRPLTESLAFNYWPEGVAAALFLVFAAIALLLAAVGLYAVVAYSVSRRIQEIGVRMAIGATSRDIVGFVFRQGMFPVATGLCAGLAASFAVTPILKSQLVQLSPSDPVTLAAASAVLVLSAVLGCIVPAYRAMRVDPVDALRHE